MKTTTTLLIITVILITVILFNYVRRLQADVEADNEYCDVVGIIDHPDHKHYGLTVRLHLVETPYKRVPHLDLYRYRIGSTYYRVTRKDFKVT